MDWSNEDYVRMYTRETADDLELSWEALALWRALLCKFDRAGVIQVKNGWRSIAALTRIPFAVVELAGPELVADGRIRETAGGFFSPNFTEAQTTSKSDKARQRDSRDRRRAHFSVTDRDGSSRYVTEGHGASRDVTLTSAPLASTKPAVAEISLSPPAAATATAKPKPTKVPKVRPLIPKEAEAAARRLLDRIATNTPTSTLAGLSESAKADRARKWGDAFRLLHERDGHSWEAINSMIDWCQQDGFWKSNILSGDKLREKWDQLAARRMTTTPGGGDGRYGRGRVATQDELDESFEELRRESPQMTGDV